VKFSDVISRNVPEGVSIRSPVLNSTTPAGPPPDSAVAAHWRGILNLAAHVDAAELT
jgi:hypothetical protein